MEREHQDDLIELGVASLDTNGCPVGHIPEGLGFFCMGAIEQ